MIRRGKSRRGWLRRRLIVAGLLLIAVAAIRSLDTLPPVNDWFVNDRAYAEEIYAAARQHGLDPDLVRAVIFQESRFQADIRGGRGEIGLMQILPSGAAAEWARIHKTGIPTEKELFDVAFNLEIGCWYLSRALRRWNDYDSRLELALAQYNAGESRAKAWAPVSGKSGDVMERVSIPSTRKYISGIMGRYRMYVLRRGTDSVAASSSLPTTK